MQTIFVIGSSLHAGGFQDDTYAIPVFELVGVHPRLLTIPAISRHVDEFRAFARQRPLLLFVVGSVGCGEGGYQPGQIADLFRGMPDNVYLSARLAYGLK